MTDIAKPSGATCWVGMYEEGRCVMNYPEAQKAVVSARLARQIRLPMKQPIMPDPWHTSVDVSGTDATWWDGNHTQGIYHTARFDIARFKDLMFFTHGIAAITDLYVERVQDLTDKDCDQLGVTAVGFYHHEVSPYDDEKPHFYKYVFGNDRPSLIWEDYKKTKREAFGDFWRKTYGEKSWSDNEWVWVVTFRQIGDGV